MVAKLAQPSVQDPIPILRTLTDTVQKHGFPVAGEGNPIALEIANAEQFYVKLGRRQRAWVKRHGLQNFVLNHGSSATNAPLRLSKSRKSIILDADRIHPKDCMAALISFIQANGDAGQNGRKTMHIQLIPGFYSQYGPHVRDVVLQVEPEHQGAQDLPKSMKKGKRLNLFVESHGRSIQGYSVIRQGHHLILTSTNGVQPHPLNRLGPSISYVKSKLRVAFVVSTHLSNEQRAILHTLQDQQRIGIDLEGRLEQRNPCVSLLQIGSSDSSTFMILDLISCPQLLLPPNEGGDGIVSQQIRSLLLEKEIVVHDCRNDCAALWGQFGIIPSKIFDTQVGYSVLKYGVVRPWKRHGFNDVARVHGIVNPYKTQVEHKQGLWEQRPLPQDLLIYSAFDVLPLVRMATSILDKCTTLQNGAIYKHSSENAAAKRDTSVQPSYLSGSFYRAIQSGNPTATLMDFADDSTAKDFHLFVSSNRDLREKCADRSNLQQVFDDWAKAKGIQTARNTLPFVLAILRKKKLLRSSRRGDLVFMIFALPDGTFPSQRARAEARSKALKSRKELEADKNGVGIFCAVDAKNIMVPTGQLQEVPFYLKNTAVTPRTICDIQVLGPHRGRIQLSSPSVALPYHLAPQAELDVGVDVMSRGPGVFRAVLAVSLSSEEGQPFTIARFLTTRSGDTDVSDLLKPTAPFRRIERKRSTINEKNIVDAPRANIRGTPFPVPLPTCSIPDEVTKLLKYKEMGSVLASLQPLSVQNYTHYWKNMLWACEYQASIDVMLFDMEKVSLQKSGRYFSLNVPGLAEGRPSVLRGDQVIVTLKGRSFKGRTVDTQLEEVVLDFKPLFSSQYDERLDRVNVRFTINRSIFMAGHQGCALAPDAMGKQMLFPDENDKKVAVEQGFARPVPAIIRWRNRTLNLEQQAAVQNILKGSARPLPYILFGPPGTGKTTTIVETVLHLAKHEHNLKLLIVAPSNDATDNLVERLSECFPPSEMRRVLAMSRSLDQVAPKVRPYVVEGLEEEEDVKDIMSKQIVAATVNMAAKLYNKGIKRGHFDVLCIDEAGHAVESEVISVAATLMDFARKDYRRAQIVLSGDPRQLGPVITSSLCKSLGMERSYMERLADSPVYRSIDGKYPEEMLTKLVRNFRSHPQILKLPNDMFYDNELKACGDHFQTHFQWEHLPKRGFPVVFHSVFGENERESNSPSWFNRQEAEIVLNYVRLLVRNSRPTVDMSDIGIITPYARQVQKIRLLLKANDFGGVKVGSVETFQGQERRCIIVSTVRSSENFLEFDAKYNLGFVNNPKRFNVTVTRAKALLIVVGQPHVLATDTKHWRPLLKMCKDAGSWLGEPWNERDVAEEESLHRLGMIDEQEAIEDDDESREEVSHAVNQEAVPFMNREE